MFFSRELADYLTGMRVTCLLRFICLSLLAFSACSRPERDAQDLLAAAQELVQRAESLREEAPVDALSDLRSALAKIQSVQSWYPGTVAQQDLARNLPLFAGKTLGEIREQLLPDLEERVRSESDPLSCAGAVLRKAPAGQERFELLRKLSGRMSSAGRKEEAKEALRTATGSAEGLETEGERIQALLGVALEYDALPVRNYSLGVAFRAFSMAKQIEDREAQALALQEVAETYYRLGVKTRSYEAIRSIADRERRYKAVFEIGRSLVMRSLFNETVLAAEALYDPLARVRYFLAMGQATLDQGLSGPVRQFLLPYRGALPLISDRATRLPLLAQGAKLYRKSGQRDQALELMNEAKELQKQVNIKDPKVAARLSSEYAALGLKEEALALINTGEQLLKKIDDSDIRQSLQVSFVSNTARLDYFERAYKLLDELEGDFYRALGLIEIATFLLEGKRDSDAAQALGKVQDCLATLSDRDEFEKILNGLRDRLLLIGNFEGAVTLSLKYQSRDSAFKSNFKKLVELLAKLGELPRALDAVRGLPDPLFRAVLLLDLGRFERVEEDHERAAGLFREAAAMSKEEQDSGRRQLLEDYLIGFLLQEQQPELASEIINRSPSPDPLWQAKLAVALAAAAQGEAARTAAAAALQRLPALKDPLRQAEILIELSALTEKGDTTLPESALAVFRQLTRPSHRAAASSGPSSSGGSS